MAVRARTWFAYGERGTDSGNARMFAGARSVRCGCHRAKGAPSTSAVRVPRAGFLIACALLGQAQEVHARATIDLCAQRDSVRALVPDSALDDHFEIAARLLPGGFGGLTTAYMFLTQPALADSARHVAGALAGCRNDEYSARLWTLVQRVAVRRGDYDWIELRKWYGVVLRNVSWDGVRSGDIDEGTNRLAYTFATQTALDAFRVRAQSLGVPVGALALSVDKGTRWPASSAARRSGFRDKL